MLKADSRTLLKLNRLVRSNRLKFAAALAADVLGLRYTIVRMDPVAACNLRCAMCYYSDGDWYAANAGPRLTAARVERLAGAFFPEAVQVFIGCGSEPTMWKGYPDIVGLAKRYGVPFVSLVTNAQLLTQRTIEDLVTRGLDEIIVSVHGTDAATYERLMKGARWTRLHDNLKALTAVRDSLGSKTPALRINFTVNNDNVGQIAELPAVFGPYSPATIQIRPIIDLGNTAYADKDLSRSLEAYDAGIEQLRRDCAAAGIALLANAHDPLYGSGQSGAKVYENAVLRYIGPTRAWKTDFDVERETYAGFKARIGFRRSLLRWAVLGSRDLEHHTVLASSDVL
ncbi:radical SAM protein [Azospirillum halopraeferens]|uniref:radical SAM protein n=1 Tax=Azospirillum halopraeferens TaxID=34010 RepID=UPI0004019E5F|nr:radical SAM protein [Azospirillum halopraeferens]